MEKKLFDISNFNIINDNEFYYFFRALNMGDNEDIEKKIILDKNLKIKKIRTDRQRFEENFSDKKPKYTTKSIMNLEQVYDHIKDNHNIDTNCISISTNSNVNISYGRVYYKDKYVILMIPKSNIGKKVINAGQYILEKIDEKNEKIEKKIKDEKIKNKIYNIKNAKNSKEIENMILVKYKSKSKIKYKEKKLRKGILYKPPILKISNYNCLNDSQNLEKNKIIGEMLFLELNANTETIIKENSNKNLIKTLENAFYSLELIHYGEIEKEYILELPKNSIDIFSLLQQVEDKYKIIVKNIEIEVINYLKKNPNINIEIYEDNKKVDSKIYYLAKSRLNTKKIINYINKITNNNSKYQEIIKYMDNNCFRLEPEIISRLNKHGIKISEAISFDLEEKDYNLIDKVKKMSQEELLNIVKNSY